MLWKDLRAFAAQRSRHEWVAAFFAVAMPVAILIVFTLDAKTNILPGEQVIYAESWRADRSDEEIRAAQQLRQREREAAEAERRRQWRELGNRLGMEP